jgi:hypothetical protein
MKRMADLMSLNIGCISTFFFSITSSLSSSFYID